MSRQPAASANPPDDRSRELDRFLIAHGGPFYHLQQRLGLLHERALNAGRRAALLVGTRLGRAFAAERLFGARGRRRRVAAVPARSRRLGALLHRDRNFRADGAPGRGAAPGTSAPVRARAPDRPRRAAGGGRGGDARPAAARSAASRSWSAWSRPMRSISSASTCSCTPPPPPGSSPSDRGRAADARRLVVRAGQQPACSGSCCCAGCGGMGSGASCCATLRGLDLRLVATHPDGAGGLAFIGQYPNAFAAFVFALSCVLGAAIAHTLLRGGLTAATYGQLMCAWLVVVVILFGAPLLAFSGPLRRLKEATLLAAGAVATRRERAAERELLGRNMSAASDADAAASERHSGPCQVLCGGDEALDLPDLALGDRAGCRRRAPAAGRCRRDPAAGSRAAQDREGPHTAVTRPAATAPHAEASDRGPRGRGPCLLSCVAAGILVDAG